jgi:predicted DNA-binding transcriptional regulator AlpA
MVNARGNEQNEWFGHLLLAAEHWYLVHIRCHLMSDTDTLSMHKDIVLLSEGIVARSLGLSKRTLQRYRESGTGPEFIRLGEKRIGYPLTALAEWLAARTFNNNAAENGVSTIGPGQAVRLNSKRRQSYSYIRRSRLSDQKVQARVRVRQ